MKRRRGSRDSSSSFSTSSSESSATGRSFLGARRGFAVSRRRGWPSAASPGSRRPGTLPRRGLGLFGALLVFGKDLFFELGGFRGARDRGRGGGLGFGPELGQRLLQVLPARFLEVDEVTVDLGFADLGLDPGVLGGFLVLAGGLEPGLELVLALPDLAEGRLGLLERLLARAALFFEGFRLHGELPTYSPSLFLAGLALPDLLFEGGDLGLGGLLAPGEALDLDAEAVHLLGENVAFGLEPEIAPFVLAVLLPDGGELPAGGFDALVECAFSSSAAAAAARRVSRFPVMDSFSSASTGSSRAMMSAEVEAFSISMRPNFRSRSRSWRARSSWRRLALPFEGGFEGAALGLPGFESGGGRDDLFFERGGPFLEPVDLLGQGDHAVALRSEPEEAGRQQEVARRRDEVQAGEPEPEPDGSGGFPDDDGLVEPVEVIAEPVVGPDAALEEADDLGVAEDLGRDFGPDPAGDEEITALEPGPEGLQELLGKDDAGLGLVLPEDVEEGSVLGARPDEVGQEAERAGDVFGGNAGALFGVHVAEGLELIDGGVAAFLESGDPRPEFVGGGAGRGEVRLEPGDRPLLLGRAPSRDAISDSKRARAASVSARRAAWPEAWDRSFSSWRRTSSSSFSIWTALFRFSVSSWNLRRCSSRRAWMSLARPAVRSLASRTRTAEASTSDRRPSRSAVILEAGACLDGFELEGSISARSSSRPASALRRDSSRNSARLVSRSISPSRRAACDLTA